MLATHITSVAYAQIRVHVMHVVWFVGKLIMLISHSFSKLVHIELRLMHVDV
jgi:hypothetical protein